MFDSLIMLAILEVFLIVGCSFLGMFCFLVGFYNLTLDGRKIGILKMSIGGLGLLIAVTFQNVVFEMPYLLIWAPAVWIPALLEASLIFQTNEKKRLVSLVVALTIALVGPIVSLIIHYGMAKNALRGEPDSYIMVETAGPVIFPLRDLGDGKYLIARDGGLEYEIITNGDDSAETVLSQDDNIEVLPLSTEGEPHLTVTETTRHERCPGMKILGESRTLERTVAIYVAPNQTAVAYSER